MPTSKNSSPFSKPPSWTERGLASIKVKKRQDFTDPNEKGLVLRVTPNGGKSWALLYRRKSDGKKCRFTIGPFGSRKDEITLAVARDRAATLRAEVVAGRDPAMEKGAIRRAETVKDLLETFITQHKRPGARWTIECKRIFKKDVEPVIGHVKLPLLARYHVREVLERVKRRGATTTVNRTLAALRRALSWAVQTDLLAVSPAAGMATDIVEYPKDRALTEVEIRAFWEGLDVAPMGERARLALRIVLLTGQRPGEVCGALRSELDLDAGRWTLPGSRTKNGKPQVVPLHRLTVELFKAVMELGPESEFVFTTMTRTRGEPVRVKAMDGHALSHAMRDSLEQLGLLENPATPHDLRRTVATHMARIGIPAHHVGHVLNHGTQLRRTITERVYVTHDFLPEKSAALQAWGNELERIIGQRSPETNVVQLRG